MARIVIAGGGFAGLSGALLAARQGHDVIVIDRDPPPPPPEAGPDADFAGWRRPGAPQSRQSHLLLAAARKVLVEEAPDLLQALLDRGVREQVAGFGAGLVEGEKMLLTRRLVTEACLRRLVEQEARVAIRAGEAVAGLEARPGPVPRVTGVRTTTGEVVPADLVVEAGGHRSSLPRWLEEIGARPVAEQTQECGFFYLTRFYRTRPGLDHPLTQMPVTPYDYGKVFAVGADNGCFSIAICLSVRDPYRKALRDEDRHARFLDMVPLTRPWLSVADPITGIAMMAGIENRRRRLVDGDGPVVGGLVSIGDSSLRTNPTLGRGVAISFLQAQHLAHALEGVDGDPFAFVQDAEEWNDANLGPWFDSQVKADASAVARLEAGLRGERLPAGGSPAERFTTGAYALGRQDPVVGAAVARVVNMLDTADVALDQPEVKRRVDAFLDTDPDLERPPDSPSRADFERIAQS